MSARRRMLSLSIFGDASTCTQRSHSSSPPPDGVPAAAVVAAAIGSTLRSSIRRWPMPFTSDHEETPSSSGVPRDALDHDRAHERWWTRRRALQLLHGGTAPVRE